MEKQQIEQLLEKRAAELLAQLNGYQDIENEYRSTAKALKVLRGESIGGRAKSNNPEDIAQRRNISGTVKMSSEQVLRALASLSNGGRASDVAKEMNLDGNVYRARLNVMLPYLAKRGFVKGNAGHYTMTAKGRQEVAQGVMGLKTAAGA